MTNEEKIKAMTRKELAKLIDDISREGKHFVDPPYCKKPCTEPVYYPCRLCAEKWLKQEAKE